MSAQPRVPRARVKLRPGPFGTVYDVRIVIGGVVLHSPVWLNDEPHAQQIADRVNAAMERLLVRDDNGE